MSPAHAQALTLREAADALGVHYMTVYRYVRLGMLPARKENGAWHVDRTDLDRLDTNPQVPARKRAAPWRQRLKARMVAGDEAGAFGVVEAALSGGIDPRQFYCDVLTPALHEIGEEWAAGDIGVEEEHLATAVATGIIGRLGPLFARRGRPKGTVVLAMPSGERHQLGAAMLADVIRSEGYRALNLGADTPADALVGALAGVDDLVAVAISAVTDQGRDNAAAMINHLRVEWPELLIVAGGAAVASAEQAQMLGADGWAARACDIGDLISRLRTP
jgi:excisionase family DNA binding protein